MRALASVAFLLPLASFADTVVLKNGTRYDGTFVEGTSRRLVLVDDNGSRRTFDLRDVQELSFGQSVSTSSGSTSTDRASLLNKLSDDVRIAMENTTLSAWQENTLEDARKVLARAAQERRPGQLVSFREMRRALDNIRDAMDSNVFRERDRSLVAEDLRQVRDLYRDFRDEGTRSRTRLR